MPIHIFSLVFLHTGYGYLRFLPRDRKSYSSQAILHRLSREGSTLVANWNSCALSSSDVIAMLNDVIMRNCILAYAGTSGSLFFQ